jgi:hypothetical protein
MEILKLKNTIIQIKNSLKGFNSRMEMIKRWVSSKHPIRNKGEKKRTIIRTEFTPGQSSPERKMLHVDFLMIWTHRPCLQGVPSVYVLFLFSVPFSFSVTHCWVNES